MKTKAFIYALLSGISVNSCNLLLKAFTLYHHYFLLVLSAGLGLLAVMFLYLAYRAKTLLSLIVPLTTCGQLIVLPVSALYFNELVEVSNYFGMFFFILGVTLILD